MLRNWGFEAPGVGKGAGKGYGWKKMNEINWLRVQGGAGLVYVPFPHCITLSDPGSLPPFTHQHPQQNTKIRVFSVG